MILSTIILMFKTDLDFTLIHSFGLIYALFTNAFLGFLITVIPKYNAVLEIESKKYIPTLDSVPNWGFVSFFCKY